MDRFTDNDLRQLIGTRGQWCVSIYLPTHPTWPQNEPDHVRLDKLVHEAERQLVARRMRPAQAREFLLPARTLGQDQSFWKDQGNGLAVFLGDGFERHYRLPLHFDELLTVAGRFTIRPLLPLLTDDLAFYVLALTQQDVRLIRSTRWNAEEIALPPHPRDVGEATGFDAPERGFAYHAGDRIGQSKRRAALVHSTGIRPHDSKEDLLEYSQALDDCLHRLLRDERAPLVLAGVDPLLSTFRRASTYPHLLEQGLPGATERQSTNDLRVRAWPLVEAELWKSRQPLVDRYRQSIGTGAATGDIVAALRAALSGQVAVLFVDERRRIWGRSFPEQDIIDVRERQEAGDVDLVDEACVHTLAHRGKVFVLPGDRMPNGSAVAALFRR